MAIWHTYFGIAQAIRKVVNDTKLYDIYLWEIDKNWTDAQYKNWLRNFDERCVKLTGKRLVSFVPAKTIKNRDYLFNSLKSLRNHQRKKSKENCMGKKKNLDEIYKDVSREDLIKIIEELKKHIKMQTNSSFDNNDLKFTIVDSLKDNTKLSLRKLLPILELSNSRYYERANRILGRKTREDALYSKVTILSKIADMFELHKGRLSINKMRVKLIEKYNLTLSLSTIWKCYMILNFVSKPGSYVGKKRFIESKNTKKDFPNLLTKELLKSIIPNAKPGEYVSADFAIIPSRKYGHLHLFYIVDILTHKILAWKICFSQTAKVVLECLKQLSGIKVFHTDHGSQFFEENLLEYLRNNNIQSSMGRVGCSTDNRWVEYVFGRTRIECLNFENTENLCHWEISRILREYVRWYNNERPIKTLGYKSPNAYIYNLTNN